LRRRLARVDLDRLRARTLHPEGQVDRLRIPDDRSGNDHAAQPYRCVVGGLSARKQLRRLQEIDQVLANAAVDHITEGAEYEHERDAEPDSLARFHERFLPVVISAAWLSARRRRRCSETA